MFVIHRNYTIYIVLYILILNLQILLIEFKNFPLLFAGTLNAIQELTQANAFERYFFQLKKYFTDVGDFLSQSPPEYPNFGISSFEQSHMEDAYNHALTARQMVPHETNVYIMDLLAWTLK
ncbi:putative 26S proteasome non-ATPase regulatory subunit Rpn12 [Helianthus annuus]|nr:putative 26S proteasome non-ATPase regulatory subunit Rpn12 [Helianthus annuus]